MTEIYCDDQVKKTIRKAKDLPIRYEVAYKKRENTYLTIMHALEI